ncbi:type II and III secretion system protein family protein [Caulobacter sp. UNC279MFTsu5.1]|uniref:type II and III secretion system protein family protein n=1 Tax=Caulobacter sp. UNC279MFTsu5.1 TaxID=1502775 RepID=UPI00037EA25C|nr:type II and III secretion system protein family protein [Caulobacter sp. UNC279MFTsu5.1]SFJ71727.1 pilus assembly protein CpaC [Caulobacter sp. UNC279MFTsu5.1]
MIRRLLSASLAAVLALASSTAALADGPAAGTHLYRTPARVASRPIETPTLAPPADQVLRIDLTTTGAQSLVLSRGKSAIIELPVDVRDMLVTNPAVADAVLRGPRRIYVLGMALGATDAVFFDASGRKILSLAIRVEQDSTALEETLRRVLPNANIQVQAIRDSVILTGAVANTGEAGMASQIASKFVDKPDNVLNMLTIAGKDQVMLKVRIVEVQRNIIKQLGFNTGAVLGQLGGAQYSFGMSPTFGVNGALLGGVTGGYKLDTTKQPIAAAPAQCTNSTVVNGSNIGNCVGVDRIGSDGLNSASAMVQAFERVGLLRTLAEPNLTVVSGESGKFLVGGEFPIPVSQDISGRVSLEFKPYGVGLGYTPVVMSGGRISLKLSTEVSELTSLGAFTLASSTGGTNLSVPGLTVRRAETTVELPSGGSLMIAGLLQQTSKQNIDALPGMTNLPILGSLFRSRDYLNGETELVVIITPYIVDPTKPQNLQTPADGLQTASDMGTVLLGRLNKVVKAPDGANSGRAYQGPVGYVIE